jgi:hypothetical protein
MAKKQSLNAAAGEPQGYEYPGTIAGRKFVFEELTIKAIRQLQHLGRPREEGEGIDSTEIIDLVFDMLTSPKVRVTDGPPFVKGEVEEELGVRDVTALFRFFTNPTLTPEELTATDEGESEEGKAA